MLPVAATRGPATRVRSSRLDLHHLHVCGVAIVAPGCDSLLGVALRRRPPGDVLVPVAGRVALTGCRHLLRDRSRLRRCVRSRPGEVGKGPPPPSARPRPRWSPPPSFLELVGLEGVDEAEVHDHAGAREEQGERGEPHELAPAADVEVDARRVLEARVRVLSGAAPCVGGAPGRRRVVVVLRGLRVDGRGDREALLRAAGRWDRWRLEDLRQAPGAGHRGRPQRAAALGRHRRTAHAVIAVLVVACEAGQL